MFRVGDKIFYPMHGGGIIEKIEEIEILGKTQLYYVANILHRNMQVKIPIDKTEKSGMRQIVDAEKLDDLLNTFHDGETDTSMNETQRHRKNLTKIKSGDISEEIEVIRDLVRINTKKKLGIADKNMLDNVRQILISEVVLVKGIPQEQAADLLDQIINVN
ncbi:MAG TPA: CarD family transcriptional regulator [Methylomusa anaerophila]|uniref:RNA polymerase-binding transcription factor CarD n=1 Tax=Methylomusa anaerophila TaxID=1930071 RepID=A0A348ALQ9_9FIRM|nr:CarD family transcriptional regulator [Methylomusa anaerophila]BBB92007.1 RNA polymerase-binding transcription factor CarD [Methylomusa anaerophila]HML87981.1 CarD family transcriptional regulator [Methylomusa anaerophila]